MFTYDMDKKSLKHWSISVRLRSSKQD